MGITNFLVELKRRHVYRAGGAYAIAAFGLIEIVSNVAPMFDLPAWVGRALVLLLLTGLPVTLLAAWMIEAKPAEGVHAPSTTRLDYVLAGAVVLMVGILIYQQVARDMPAQRTAATSAEGASIAVLPFLNLSRDPDQEFFSDGMTEEITSALAKVKGLRVVGRTSAFEFKGQNKDLRAIGKALSASHVLEGSVRKAGSHVRITAQLIRADDGTHIWTDNYDRELTDIFVTQDAIAKAITEALQVPLGLNAGETLVASRNIDPENYQKYLRAKALVRARNARGALADPIGLLEQVVAHDPGYAPAWAQLALAYGFAPYYDVALSSSVEELRQAADAALPKAEAAGRRAIELDPSSADAFAGLARALALRGRFLEAEDSYKKALKLDAYNPDVLDLYSKQVAVVGRLEEAVALREQLRSLEPLVPAFNSDTMRYLWLGGQAESALAMAKNFLASPAYGTGGDGVLARNYASMGQYKEAADFILSVRERYPPGGAEAAVRLLRMAPTAVAPQNLPDLGSLSWVYLYVGAPERALDSYQRSIEAGYSDSAFYLHPSYAPARKTERFKALMRKAGLVDYWRARGWPDVCHPVGNDDFECS